MITLKRDEEIEIFQVELALKSKTKQSPFIAILILAQESDKDGYYICSEDVQSDLLPSLPIRACENLLKRLQNQGYFAKECIDDKGYVISKQGIESAIDKSFWIGEKGLYNVFVSKSNLIEQRIIRIEKVERAENDKDSRTKQLPREIKQYENQVLTIDKKEVLFEDIEERCFQLQPLICVLEIHAKGNESILKISKDSQSLFQTDLEIEENILQEELLVACGEFEYDEDKKAILTEFSKDNLSFNRKVKIGKPIFKNNQFNPVELENISHIPSDKENADLWYWELLYKNMNDYFLDENSFKEFATELAKPIQLHFKIKIPKQKELAEILNEREDAFYQIAKLETIDYLNY